jgi:itaconyl-CoA hydratase
MARAVVSRNFARAVRARARGVKGAEKMNEQPGFGRCLEDFEVGAVYRHPLGRTVTETDNVWFTALTMNTNQLHFNDHYSEQGLFGRPLVNSTLTMAIVTGLSVIDISQHAVANLGWDEVRLPHPLFVGDTLYAESRVEEVRPSRSRPDAGIVTVRTRGMNQDGQVVLTFRRSVLVARRGHEPSTFPTTDAEW